MSWAIGFDSKWQRDVGYGVPAYCDCGCGAVIDRGLAYICGGEMYGGEFGCGLFFADAHLFFTEIGKPQLCTRCAEGEPPFTPTDDHPEWIRHKLTDPSWAEWRKENPAWVALQSSLKGASPA